MEPDLSERDAAMLAGAEGPALRLAMRIVAGAAAAMGASRLRDVTRAHIDGCLYHGRAGLEFARRLRDDGGRVAVPTTLNVSSLDLVHPELYRGDPETGRLARELMACYEDMGCRPTWTCAPYQLPDRPRFGEHVAWAESNAIVFANSVLGARTHRYGDFIDICAALTGRVPDAGLHRDEHRRGRIRFRVDRIPERLQARGDFFPLLGHVIGERAGSMVPVIDGLAVDPAEDDLKALGAAAASSGSVGMFHAVGVTPEAGTLADATGGGALEAEVTVTSRMLAGARRELSTGDGGSLDTVCLGTPHASLDELRRLVMLLEGRHLASGLRCYVSTGRDVLAGAAEEGVVAALEESGVTIVADTCTYVTAIIAAPRGPVMTNSAKWAYYAPGNLGVDVVFGSLEECVESAVAGEVRREPGVWDGV